MCGDSRFQSTERQIARGSTMDEKDLGETEQKIVALTSLINADQTNADNYAERSELFNELNLHTQALEDAKMAIQTDPTNIQGYIAAGRATMKLKRYDECYNFYKDGLAIAPKDDVIKEDLKKLQTMIVEDFDKQGQTAPERDYSAVEFCSQEYYPGDDDAYRSEIEILAAKYKVVANPPRTKADVSLKLRKEAASVGVMAFNCKQQGQFDEALHFCTEALKKDGTNDRLLQMRSEIFLELGNEKMALQDLMTIPKQNRLLDVWRMGGKILIKFDLPVMAEFWLRKATAMSPKTDKEAATLFQQVRVKRLYGPLAKDYPVTVDFREYGRSVFATESLSEGEDAFDDFPVVVGKLMNNIHLPGCDHCGMPLYTEKDYFGKTFQTMPKELRDFAEEHWPDVEGVKCGKCKREQYCSENCRTEAWNRYHGIICPSVNSVGAELYDLIDAECEVTDEKGMKKEVWLSQYSPIVLAKIWAQIVSEAKRLMASAGETKPTTEHWAKAKMPFRKFIAFGQAAPGKRIPEIHNLMKRLFADCGDGVSFDITDSEFESRYLQATCNLQAFSSSVTPFMKFMEKLSTIEDMRSLRLLKYLEQKPPSVMYAGMFSLHACLNHACDNNVEVMDGFVNGKPAVHVRVRRDIKPGEELFTTYIDTAMPRKLRRAWLYKSFNFWCFCRRCQFEGDDNTSCTNCKKPASEGKKFPGCGRCKKAWYCSTKCQKENWAKGHRRICDMDHTIMSPSMTQEK